MRLLLLTPLLILSLTACGKPPAAKAPATQGASSEVNLKGGEGQDVAIKAGAAAGLAAPGREAPAYAPAYPGSTILSRVETGVRGGNLTILKFTTKDTPDKVAKFYRDAAGKAGVPVSADMSSDGGVMFAAEEEGGDKGMQLTASASAGQTVVQLTYHAPKG